MADWNFPTVASLYKDVLRFFSDRLVDAARMFNPALVTASNLPEGVIRWNPTARRWETWSGTAWEPLTSSYAMDISGNAATSTVSQNCNGRSASAAVADGCSGNAATATEAQGGSFLTRATGDEGLIGCRKNGKESVVLFNAENSWGVRSQDGGVAFWYDRPTGKFIFSNLSQRLDSIASAAAGKAPKPEWGGIGQWAHLTGGFTVTIPPGGVWAYFFIAATAATGGTVSSYAGLAVGGAVVGHNGVAAHGFCWRID